MDGRLLQILLQLYVINNVVIVLCIINTAHDLQVLKRLVDSYEQGKIIPKCQFSAKILPREGEDIPSLQCQVKLNGAKEPFNVVMLDIEPPILTTGTYDILQ